MQAGQSLADWADATPRTVLLAVEAYHDRRAWDAWATGNVAMGRVAKLDDLLPQVPESDAEREARIDRAIMAWNIRFDEEAKERNSA